MPSKVPLFSKIRLKAKWYSLYRGRQLTIGISSQNKLESSSSLTLGNIYITALAI